MLQQATYKWTTVALEEEGRMGGREGREGREGRVREIAPDCLHDQVDQLESWSCKKVVFISIRILFRQSRHG